MGLINLAEPDERDESVRACIRLGYPDQLGLSDTSIVQADLSLLWDQNLLLIAIDGEIGFSDGAVMMLLAPPGGWDGTQDVWVGTLSNTTNLRSVLVALC
ncbi:hypothetical protein OO25_08090 [Phaeobacter sp. S60]|nr:hypothetical protein OO25_08090 [Phaeobacter sp. S60]